MINAPLWSVGLDGEADALQERSLGHAIFVPHGIVLEEANHVAADLGLPRSWLDEQASVYGR
jgi:hypothetical protein